MTMTEENPLYVKYLKNKHKFIKKYFKSHNIYDNENAYNAFIYLCYVTRLYFRDNVLISYAKLAIGLAALVTALLMEFYARAIAIKSLVMVCLFGYSVFMIPLSILYIIANYICYFKYLDYVTTPESVLAKRIIVFYDDDTDKFKAVNWTNVFRRDSNNYNETKRKRGW